MNITITGIWLEGHSVTVPTGLSELVNAAGAWGIRKNEPSIIEQYDRKVIKRDGCFVTVLTKRED